MGNRYGNRGARLPVYEPLDLRSLRPLLMQIHHRASRAGSVALDAATGSVLAGVAVDLPRRQPSTPEREAVPA